jgi:hypothetical protein
VPRVYPNFRGFENSEIFRHHNSELDLSVNSSEIYGKSRPIGPSPIQNCDFHLHQDFPRKAFLNRKFPSIIS